MSILAPVPPLCYTARMIIGLTGKNCAGKGEVAACLRTSGFQYYSLSDVLRDEMQAAGIPITRERLIQFANELRAARGHAALAEVVLRQLDPEKNYIVDSIRNPAEVQALQRRPDFVLLRVEADAKLRFERMRQRAREGDPTNLREFQKLEAAEAHSTDPASQQLEAVSALATVAVVNDGNLDQLHDRVRRVVRELAAQHPRPDWHQYFMEIAKVVAMRSNCIKRKVAAVIVQDKRIISTGYNGTPRGIMNCNEGGCPRCNAFGTSGQGLENCLCSHAEENAIVQAAYHGVHIKGATIYTTFSPCLLCTKMIINAGLAEVIYQTAYPMEQTALELLRQVGITVTTLQD